MKKYPDNNTVPQEPIIVFFLTPPNSGSTVLAKLLATDPKVCLLSSRGEGGWLVPELRSKARWDPIDFNAERLKRTWLSRFHNKRTRDNRLSVIVEKSPPNMVRIETMLSLFDSTLCFALVRNPYATVASRLTRQKLAWQEQHKSIPKDAAIRHAKKWCQQASILKQKCDQLELQVIRYEDFCADPKSALESINGLQSIVDSIDYSRELLVKDYSERKPVRNANTTAISTASAAELSDMTNVFKDHLQLLTRFGYRADA